jgi:hypothetical protein
MSDGARIKPRTAPPPARERSRERASPPQQPPAFDAPRPESKRATQGRKKPGLQMDAAIVTVAAPEPSVTLEKFWVEVDGHLPCGFDVATRPGHGLEVVMEQRAYRKVYTATGSLKTGLAPNAPIGTKGRVIARDTTTGETVEQPWTWHLIRGDSGGGLWQLIKRLLWKGN